MKYLWTERKREKEKDEDCSFELTIAVQHRNWSWIPSLIIFSEMNFDSILLIIAEYTSKMCDQYSHWSKYFTNKQKNAVSTEPDKYTYRYTPRESEERKRTKGIVLSPAEPTEMSVRTPNHLFLGLK